MEIDRDAAVVRTAWRQDHLPCGRPVRLLMSVCSGPLATGVIGGGHLQFQCGPGSPLARSGCRRPALGSA